MRLLESTHYDGESVALAWPEGGDAPHDVAGLQKGWRHLWAGQRTVGSQRLGKGLAKGAECPVLP